MTTADLLPPTFTEPVPGLTSISGILALLNDSDPAVQSFSLHKLNSLVPRFWAEMSESLPALEALYDSLSSSSNRELASLLISKIYFYLGSHPDALTYALSAGPAFDLQDSSEYSETIRCQCIDSYISLQQRHRSPAPPDSMSISLDNTRDRQILSMMDRIIEASFSPPRLREVISIAIDAERLDLLERILALKTPETPALLYYIQNLCTEHEAQSPIQFRTQVLALLVPAYLSLSSPDYASICACYTRLNDASSLARLFHSSLDPNLLYQLAFIVYERSKPSFLAALLAALPQSSSTVHTRLAQILSGDISTRLHLEFLCKNNHTPKSLLATTKSHLNPKSSAHHSALTVSHAILNYGTTNDEFLRQNLEFLSYATNWSKFIATSCLGLIHQGHTSNALHLLSPYLPPSASSPGSTSVSPYSEGGSLFALGLIHAKHRPTSSRSIIDYLLSHVPAHHEIIQHGAALGLGAASIGSQDQAVYDALKTTLFTDSAVAGEAAAIAIGLVMLGSAPHDIIQELFHYAHDTQHEKIIRGISIAIALMVYGLEDQADHVIDQLCLDKDPLLKYGGMYCIGLAYAGTGNHRMLKRLLHVAVSDANDDVRRAAVICVGLIMYKQPKQVPALVQLLTESHHPHVRYGAALSLGIGCAGTGHAEALALLEPLAADMVDFVRQGALIGMGMVLVQHSDGTSGGRAGQVRGMYEKIIASKYEGVPTKVGAVLGQALIDAGGGNVTICPGMPNGAVGLALWSQFWYWYPMLPFISLAFQPTALICLDGEFRLPVMEVVSEARPSMFAYVEKRAEEGETKDKVLSVAVLSTAAKAARIKSKRRKSSVAVTANNTDGNGDNNKNTNNKNDGNGAVMVVDTIKKEETKQEPETENVKNFSRVTPLQREYVKFIDGRYVLVCKEEKFSGGIQVVKDKSPGGKEEWVMPASWLGEGDAEVVAPEEFVYREE